MGRIHELLFRVDSAYTLYRNTLIEMKKIRDKRRVQLLSQIELSTEQKQEIDKLFLNNYGRKVPYDWHRYYTSYSGHFDARFIPENLFIPRIVAKLVNPNYSAVFADKNLLPMLVGERSGVRTAKVLLSCTEGIYRDADWRIISKQKALDYIKDIGEAFIKPTKDSDSGRGCAVVNIQNGVDLNSGRAIHEIDSSMGLNYNIQERVINSEVIARLHPNSINTFRVITYIVDGSISHVPVAMRIGRGGNNCDNAHSGGIFIGVSDDGYLLDCAYTEFQERFKAHPDSGIEFNNYYIPGFRTVVENCKRIHERFPQIGIISWDATIDDLGNTVIIELNLVGQSLWMNQMAHGLGAFGENTERILKMIAV